MFGPDRPPVCMSSLRLDHGNASEPQRWCRPLQVKKKQNNWSRQKWSDARGNIQLTARNRHTAAFKHPQRIKNAFAPLLIWLFFSWQPSLWWWAPIAACSLKAAAALPNYKLYLLQTHAVVSLSRLLSHIWLRFFGQTGEPTASNDGLCRIVCVHR